MTLPIQVHATRAEAERTVAVEIATIVRAKPDCVLGLATGDTPTGVYAELVRLSRDEGLDFTRVTTFNLDEYRDIAPSHPASFRAWIQGRFCDLVGMRAENMHLPDGRVAREGVAAHCADYERAIREAGGIDLQVLGIGRNGHIAFNEPGSARSSRTREVELHPWTRADAVTAFGSIDRVPTHAITMGIATILDARRVRVLAFGARKAEIVRRTVAGPIGGAWPASFLGGHRDIRLDVDREAAGAG